MRRLLAVLASTLLVLAACGDDDDLESSTTASSVAEETTEEGPDEGADEDGESGDDEHEGEGRDPDALFGADVCAALLQALEGNTDGLDRYATQEVLDELSVDAFHGRSDDLTITEDDGSCTIGPFGDAEYVLTLEGDGHVGQRAVAIELVVGADSGGGDAAAADLADAIAAERAESECEDDLEDVVLDVDGGTVVALECERFAYQSSFNLYLFDGGSLVPLVGEMWRDGGIVDDSWILGYPFTEQGLLANIEKGRGLGDCGTYSQWYLDGDRIFLSAVFHQDCDYEGEPVGPDEWPQVYPSGD